MKTIKTTILLLLFFANAYGQHTGFLTGKKEDFLWMRQLIEIQNKKQSVGAHKDSVEQIEWRAGKVSYSADSCLRIGQISGQSNSGASLFTAVQYLDQNKIIDLKLPKDTVNFDFQDYPIVNIYKLPTPANTYLILSGQTEPAPVSAYAQDKDSVKYENVYNVASMVHVTKDSLEETGFIVDPPTIYNKTAHITSGNSLYLNSSVAVAKDSPKPFLKFDPVKKELSYLITPCGNNDEDNGCSGGPLIDVYSGVLMYRDTAFTIFDGEHEYYPPLGSFDTTIAIKKFKTGKYVTKVVATQKYEEVGEGVLWVSHVDYYINSQTIGFIDNVGEDSITKNNLKPDYKVQKDGSLIFLVTDFTTPNHGGQCGACESEDSEFWLIKKNSKKSLFTLSSNLGMGYTEYTYFDGKSEKSGRLYVESESDETPSFLTLERTYWQNNSTYVISVSNDDSSRNFYIRFVTINKKTFAKLVAGKLQHKKGE